MSDIYVFLFLNSKNNNKEFEKKNDIVGWVEENNCAT